MQVCADTHSLQNGMVSTITSVLLFATVRQTCRHEIELLDMLPPSAAGQDLIHDVRMQWLERSEEAADEDPAPAFTGIATSHMIWCSQSACQLEQLQQAGFRYGHLDRSGPFACWACREHHEQGSCWELIPCCPILLELERAVEVYLFNANTHVM